MPGFATFWWVSNASCSCLLLMPDAARPEHFKYQQAVQLITRQSSRILKQFWEQSKSCQQTVSHWLNARDIIVQRTLAVTLREMSAKLGRRAPSRHKARDFPWSRGAAPRSEGRRVIFAEISTDVIRCCPCENSPGRYIWNLTLMMWM